MGEEKQPEYENDRGRWGGAGMIRMYNAVAFLASDLKRGLSCALFAGLWRQCDAVHLI